MEHGAGMENILIDERKIARVVLADIASARQALDEHKACDDDAQKEHDGQSRLVFPLASEATKKRWNKKAGEGRDLRRVRVPIVNERQRKLVFLDVLAVFFKVNLGRGSQPTGHCIL